ncbi:very short patch repair endonuclease [Marinobacterium stanieri]|uniref:very short patch repair endonuclease n=1 Tax=Marinobacterium stanieri TaxID=49186 RepID=UPI0002558C18|nr:very short patch repair endonuclease [Marinobacterium stanieri]
MTDIVDQATRSRMMSSIKGKNTKPEMAVRRWLHAQGYRYRLHRKDLPGKPDLVLPKYNLVIFVNGCFWHQHPGCHYAYTPASNNEKWKAKLEGNRQRDQIQQQQLLDMGWRVLIIWECGLKHSQDTAAEIKALISGQLNIAEWPDKPPRTDGVT